MYMQRERVWATAVSFSLLAMLVGLVGVPVDAVPVAVAEDFSLVDEGGSPSPIWAWTPTSPRLGSASTRRTSSTNTTC